MLSSRFLLAIWTCFFLLRSALLFSISVSVILLLYIPPSFIAFLMSDFSCCHSFLPLPHLSFPLWSSLVKDCSVLALTSHVLLLNLPFLPPEIQLLLTSIHFQWGKSKIKLSCFSLMFGLKFSGFLLLLCFIFIFYCCSFEILKGLDKGLLFSDSVVSDSLRHHGLQSAGLPCPSLSPAVLLKLMSIESVMPSNHLVLCCPLLFLPSVFPSIRVFSNELALHISDQSIGASASASVLPVNIQG